MHYVIASTDTSPIIDYLRDTLNGVRDIEFRVGSVPETAHDCDAIMMKFYLAHDRYGGTPTVPESQVLENKRDDNLPPYILSTPPFPAEDSSTEHSEVARRILIMFSTSIDRAVSHFEGECPVRSINIHLDGLGLDDIEPRYLGDALELAITRHQD